MLLLQCPRNCVECSLGQQGVNMQKQQNRSRGQFCAPVHLGATTLVGCVSFYLQAR